MAYSVILDMPKPSRFARIAITLPEKDLAAADRLARRHDRSRSWTVAEAIRRYAAADDAAAAAPAGTTGLGGSRRAQLVRDLSLTPEARVRAAEETLRVTEPRSKARTHQVAVFDRYEDFLDWKWKRRLSP
ncbi:MAG: CopG family transcriptional regulator [Gemmatimonadaceae bacterium]|nr:CopG family transcriptional regulator [Gemmatimonadaceae bacterium]MDQ3242711.1 ribbon-helix-helix domain-containing protein [Gemmatimonadota bacterium]